MVRVLFFDGEKRIFLSEINHVFNMYVTCEVYWYLMKFEHLETLYWEEEVSN
jgi:hypothetical protein